MRGMERHEPSHAQRLKEDIWLLRLFRFCPSYRPQLLSKLLLPEQIAAGY